MSDENILKLDSGNGERSPAVQGRYLPSTEFRDPIPQWEEEEIHLRDYLDVVIRRKWLIFCFLGLTFLSTLIFTLASTKIYKATTAIEVKPQDQKVTKFEEVVSSQLQNREFYETQVELLKSKTLSQKVVDKLRLEEHPVIVERVFGNGDPGLAAGLKGFLRSLLGGGDEDGQRALLIPEETLKERKLLTYIADNLEVSPSRKSMLIEVSFTSPDRGLSQDVSNSIAREFVHWNMEKKLEASQIAQEFLSKQIGRAKINLEKAEEELNRFAKQADIVSLDSKLNGIYGQLEELNNSLAAAESDLIAKNAVYEQAVKEGPSHLPQVLNSGIIANLKAEYARVRSQYEDQSVTFHDEYPAVKALKGRMQSIDSRIAGEEDKVFRGIATEYFTALKRVQAMQERVEKQKRLAIDLNERATQYKIMEREVETNKGIYQSLLQRSKEIESMVGVSSSNIHIAEPAFLPIQPFKPKVARNLLLAIFVGLIGGMGCAFVLEYFADTITNPDEIADRFQIPILGVVPLGRESDYPIEKTYIADPRAPLSEAIRTTKVSIQLSGVDAQARSFLLTSTRPSEGKTTLAANLAQTFAGAGEKVILIDTDMRKPRMHKIFPGNGNGNGMKRGLSTVLAGLDFKDFVQATDVPNLYFIPSGPIPPNPVELLASNRFRKLMEALKTRYDRVILDGPPHQGFADILILSQHVGGVVLVSSMGETTRDAVRHFKKTVLNVQGCILGCIINKVNLNKRYGYQSYYKYYSYYNYDYARDKKQTGLVVQEGEPQMTEDG